MQKKKNLAFLLGITPNLSFAAGNVSLAINRHMKTQDYDIVIYYTDLKENDINAFKKIPHVRLVKFNLPEDFISEMLQKIPDSSRFKSRNHLMCFCHFEVFPLLDEYKHVAWIDVDTSIQRDLSDIVKFSPFGVGPDTPWTVGNQFSHDIEGYDMKREGHCTAVMVVEDSLPYKQIYNWLYEKALEYADCIVNPDQAIISIMLQEFNIKPQLMNVEEWQCISWRREAPWARIVHFGSNKKVWNNINVCNAFPEWYRVHLDWLDLGGSDFDRSHIDVHNILGTLDEFDRLTVWSVKKIRLFGITFLKIKENYYRKVYYLFSLIPLISIRKKQKV